MTIKPIFRFIILAGILAMGWPTFSQETSDAKLVLTNCQVINCAGSPIQRNMTVVITGNKITSIRKGAYPRSRQKDAVSVVDLNGAYVLPGFWNVHMHLSALLPDPNHILDNETLPSAVLRSSLNAMDGLRHGFTAIRSVGERDYLDVDLRDAFDKGFFMGPRIFASGEPVSPTGGHRGDIPTGADGVAEIRKSVRTRIQKGVNLIKIMGVEMLQDELEAALETAHSVGLRVASHSREPETYRSVKSGVDSIEHGYGVKDETIKLMAEKGTFYVPTIICNLSDQDIKERDQRLAQLGYCKDEKVTRGRTLIARADLRSKEHAEHQRKALVKAVNAGVKVCIGSDSTPVGEIGVLEIEQFVLSGVSEMDALIAATRNGADLCGVLDRLGTVEEGKLADLVVVAGNPLDNISNIRKVKMVIKDGVPVDLRQPTAPANYWDYYFSGTAYRRGYLGDAEKAAGFSRGLTDPPE
ncbi:MAG TPA: amidohydrolase family protein [Patescibacteria group bacterium]|nr:amidohydrolase family protein [Patescibacteria group bacterium]